MHLDLPDRYDFCMFCGCDLRPDEGEACGPCLAWVEGLEPAAE